MNSRIPTDEIGRLMDEIMALAGLEIPNRLHLLVSQRTGLHPTTIMRYHQGKLGSANRCVHDCLRKIRSELSRGEMPFVDPCMHGPHTGYEGHGHALHSSQAARAWFDKLLRYLEQPPATILYNHLSELLGMTPGEVEGYHQNSSRAVPAALVSELKGMYRAVISGDVLIMRWDAGDVVPRLQVADLLEEIRHLGALGTRGLLFRDLQDLTGIHSWEIEQIESGATGPLVDANIYYKLRAVQIWLHYDPTRHYEVGDVLYLDDLGPGRVVEKRHKARILVEFDGGLRRLLREDIRLDPRLRSLPGQI